LIRKAGNSLKGSGGWYYLKSVEDRRRRRVKGDDFARFGFETEPSGGALDRTGLRRIYGAEAKEQGGSTDLVMVRKRRYGRAKGRSEFPVPDGYMSAEETFVAPTRRALKSVDGERQMWNPEYSAADRTPSMPVVRSIVP